MTCVPPASNAGLTRSRLWGKKALRFRSQWHRATGWGLAVGVGEWCGRGGGGRGTGGGGGGGRGSGGGGSIMGRGAGTIYELFLDFSGAENLHSAHTSHGA